MSDNNLISDLGITAILIFPPALPNEVFQNLFRLSEVMLSFSLDPTITVSPRLPPCSSNSSIILLRAYCHLDSFASPRLKNSPLSPTTWAIVDDDDDDDDDDNLAFPQFSVDSSERVTS